MKLRVENPFLAEVKHLLRDIMADEDKEDTKPVTEAFLKNLESVQDFSPLEVRMLETCAFRMERWCFDDDRMSYSCRSVLVQTGFYRPATRKENPSFYLKRLGYVPRLRIA